MVYGVFSPFSRRWINDKKLLIYCIKEVIYPSLKFGEDHVLLGRLNAKSAVLPKGERGRKAGVGLVKLTAGLQRADVER